MTFFTMTPSAANLTPKIEKAAKVGSLAIITQFKIRLC